MKRKLALGEHLEPILPIHKQQVHEVALIRSMYVQVVHACDSKLIRVGVLKSL
jgi:hypothetical protein